MKTVIKEGSPSLKNIYIFLALLASVWPKHKEATWDNQAPPLDPLVANAASFLAKHPL